MLIRLDISKTDHLLIHGVLEVMRDCLSWKNNHLIRIIDLKHVHRYHKGLWFFIFSSTTCNYSTYNFIIAIAIWNTYRRQVIRAVLDFSIMWIAELQFFAGTATRPSKSSPFVPILAGSDEQVTNLCILRAFIQIEAILLAPASDNGVEGLHYWYCWYRKWRNRATLKKIAAVYTTYVPKSTAVKNQWHGPSWLISAIALYFHFSTVQGENDRLLSTNTGGTNDADVF